MTAMPASVRPASAAPAKQAVKAEPKLTTPPGKLAAALHCAGDLRRGRTEPVLLIHGTAATGREAWVAPNDFASILRARFEALQPVTSTCPTTPSATSEPARSTSSPRSRSMSARAHRPIGIYAHSQGGLLMRWTLTYWPSLRRQVVDAVSASGSHHGANGGRLASVLIALCSGSGCPPAFWQQMLDAHLLAALNNGRDETPGPTRWTTIRTVNDDIVQPVEGAALEGATNVLIQAVCPGRYANHDDARSTRCPSPPSSTRCATEGRPRPVASPAASATCLTPKTEPRHREGLPRASEPGLPDADPQRRGQRQGRAASPGLRSPGQPWDTTMTGTNNRPQQLRHRRWFGAIAVAALLVLSGCQWQTVWVRSQGPLIVLSPPERKSVSNQTLRILSRAGRGGLVVRVRLQNTFGASESADGNNPITVAAATVARRTVGASVASTSLQALRFSGSSSVVIPPGQYVVSDPVGLNLSAGDDVATSLFISGQSALAGHLSNTVTQFAVGRGKWRPHPRHGRQCVHGHRRAYRDRQCHRRACR